MEYLVDVINELEAEREELLDKKEHNLSLIRSYDERINYYRYVIGSYNWGIKFRQVSIETYNRMLNLSSPRYNLFSLVNSSTDDYIEGHVLKLEREIDEIKSSQKTVKSGLLLAFKGKYSLEVQNKQIDIRLDQIDEEIAINNPQASGKVYKKERGK